MQFLHLSLTEAFRAMHKRRRVEIILLMTCEFHEPFLQICNCALANKILLHTSAQHDDVLNFHLNQIILLQKDALFTQFFKCSPNKTLQCYKSRKKSHKSMNTWSKKANLCESFSTFATSSRTTSLGQWSSDFNKFDLQNKYDLFNSCQITLKACQVNILDAFKGTLKMWIQVKNLDVFSSRNWSLYSAPGFPSIFDSISNVWRTKIGEERAVSSWLNSHYKC